MFKEDRLLLHDMIKKLNLEYNANFFGEKF